MNQGGGVVEIIMVTLFREMQSAVLNVAFTCFRPLCQCTQTMPCKNGRWFLMLNVMSIKNQFK